jgi:CRP-like cAMP-binding protein
VTRDRVGIDSFQLTQELISHMLGTTRTVVTVAANKLQDAGLIRYKRGGITILNRQGHRGLHPPEGVRPLPDGV